MPDTRFTARLRRFDRRLSSLVRAICVGLLAAIVLSAVAGGSVVYTQTASPVTFTGHIRPISLV